MSHSRLRHRLRAYLDRANGHIRAERFMGQIELERWQSEPVQNESMPWWMVAVFAVLLAAIAIYLLSLPS